jgi:DNA-directed RNA polymerase subunit RPC12/RpoP
MPVLRIACLDCGNAFPSLVMKGTKVPEVWVCSRCGRRRAQPLVAAEQTHHPWADGDPACPCCG